MKTPTIYDTIQNGDREERVVNQEATLAAREKQKLIKERFRSWVFTDPDRTERLVRIYNDTYNNLRPRLFDGSHLDFPGMNQTYQAAAPPGRCRLARHEFRQHAAGPRRRRRQDVHDGRHRHEDEAGRPHQEADVRRPQSPAGAILPRVHAALPQRQAARRRQGGLDPRPPQVPDRQDRQRRMGRHHRHPQQLRADRHVAGLPGEVPAASRSPNTTSCSASTPATKGANRNLIKTIEKQKAARVRTPEGPARRGQEG